LTVKTRIVDVRPQLRALKKRCVAWNNLASLRSRDIRGILGPLGFGNKRSVMLIEVAKRIESDFGSVNLTGLRKMNDGVALDYLRSLPSVGEKVARCVAMYSLGVDISPMDANATRVLSRIGVLPRGIDSTNAHFWIDRIVPPGASYRLHVNLLSHGQRCCKPVGPTCRQCVLADLCRFWRTGR
jgi:endonuclease III